MRERCQAGGWSGVRIRTRFRRRQVRCFYSDSSRRSTDPQNWTSIRPRRLLLLPISATRLQPTPLVSPGRRKRNMLPLPSPLSTGASSAENQPKPGHVAVNIPCAVVGATAAPSPPQAPHVVVLIIPAMAEAPPAPAPVGTTARALVRAYMALAVPALILLQASGASGPPLLMAAMVLIAGVFTAALFGVWEAVADQRAPAAAEGQLALQDSP